MKTAYRDTIGSAERQGTTRISEREELPLNLRKALVAYYGTDILLSPPQEQGLTAGIAKRNGRDFLISAPTNSGKTLLSIFRMFTSALSGGKRCVYVAPLKALAEEKAHEFRSIAHELKKLGERVVKVVVTTGDYQLSRDFLGSPPPKQGEIVICTPERLDIMLRNPDSHDWARAVDTYIFDEFHLIGETKRGPTLETVVTRLMLLSEWPAFMFLSATLGNPQKLLDWLSHTGRRVELIDSAYRFPELERRLVMCEDVHESLRNELKEVMADGKRLALVFVATRDAASKLVGEWKVAHPQHEFAAFHAGLGTGERNRLLVEIRAGKIKAVAATTSLKMGVNFPVTDVVIRDPVLRGKGATLPLSAADISQMVGRAGRGEVRGRGAVLLGCPDEVATRRDQMASGVVEELRPRMFARNTSWRTKDKKSSNMVDPIRGIVLSQIVVRGRAKPADVESFLQHSFSGVCHGLKTAEVVSAFGFLAQNHLIKHVEGMEGTYESRGLGKTIAYSGLSPESGCVLAGMMRALLGLQAAQKKSGKSSEDLVGRLTSLDFLFLAVCAYECRDYWLKISDRQALEEVQTYIEALPVDEKPLFNRWREESSKDYPTRRLLATLRVDADVESPGEARLVFDRIMATAILLHRHTVGESLGSLARRYSHSKRQIHEGDLESGLKYTVVWVLGCLAQICNPDKAYQMKRVQMRLLDLIEDVSLGSQMGKLMNIEGIGRRTVEKLIESGFNKVEDVSKLVPNQFVEMGVRKEQMEAMHKWLKRKNR